MSRQTTPTFAGLVQEFFTDYMVQQRALSPRTVASYRDTSCCCCASPKTSCAYRHTR
jgi:hypothetical protein